MSFRIAKEFRWAMSHRLPFHEGLCRNIHGHTYKLRVEVTGGRDEHSMVMDYYDIGEIVRPIVRKFDHSFICSIEDKATLEFLRQNDFKRIEIDGYSTAENIVMYIMDLVADSFAEYTNVERLTLRLYETEDAYAEISRDLK
jgi:6-pyruvoyltetrahydropterin/6-carboxytetrahydropterin synthase